MARLLSSAPQQRPRPRKAAIMELAVLCSSGSTRLSTDGGTERGGGVTVDTQRELSGLTWPRRSTPAGLDGRHTSAAQHGSSAAVLNSVLNSPQPGRSAAGSHRPPHTRALRQSTTARRAPDPAPGHAPPRADGPWARPDTPYRGCRQWRTQNDRPVPYATQQ